MSMETRGKRRGDTFGAPSGVGEELHMPRDTAGTWGWGSDPTLLLLPQRQPLSCCHALRVILVWRFPLWAVLMSGFGFVFLPCFVISSISRWRTELSVSCYKLLLGPHSSCSELLSFYYLMRSLKQIPVSASDSVALSHVVLRQVRILHVGWKLNVGLAPPGFSAGVNFQGDSSDFIFSCSLLHVLTPGGGLGRSRLSQHPKTTTDSSKWLLSEKPKCCTFELLMLLGLHTHT